MFPSFFLLINLYFLITKAIAQILIPTADSKIRTGISTKKAKIALAKNFILSSFSSFFLLLTYTFQLLYLLNIFLFQLQNSQYLPEYQLKKQRQKLKHTQ